jgi:hypothetical protein
VTALSPSCFHLVKLPVFQILRRCFCCNLLAISSHQSHVTICSTFTGKICPFLFSFKSQRQSPHTCASVDVCDPSSLFPAQIHWTLMCSHHHRQPILTSMRLQGASTLADYPRHHHHHYIHNRHRHYRLPSTMTPTERAGSKSSTLLRSFAQRVSAKLLKK